jgi:hypothetical protein
MKDQPHAHRGNEEADDARGCIYPPRADTYKHDPSYSRNQIRDEHSRQHRTGNCDKCTGLECRVFYRAAQGGETSYRLGKLTLLLAVSRIWGTVALAVAEPAPAAANTFDGVYTGKRMLTKGSGPACPTEENVSVTIHGETLKFTNSAQHNFVIGFEPHSDGSFRNISADAGGGSVLIQGRIAANVLDADVVNGPCEHHGHLTKGAG